MKRFIALVLGLCLLLSISAMAEKTFLTMGTGGTTGTYYALGGDIATLWSANIPDLDVTPMSTGASKANIIMISQNEAEVAFSQNDVMYYAYTGDKDVFAGEVVDSFVALGSLYPEAVQIVVGADSDIKNVADLKGKHISIGGVGSGTAVNAIQVLGGAGLTLDDVNEQYLNFDESSSAFQNKQVDAFFITSGIPNASIIEVANKRPVRLLVLDEVQMKALQEKYPFYVPVTVPKGTYAGMEEDLVIPSTNAVLIVAKTLPDELVYQMTKVLFEKTADLSHAKKAVINAQYAVTGVPVPFHPGAERYYKELGLIK